MKIRSISFHPIQSLIFYFVHFNFLTILVYIITDIINSGQILLPTNKMLTGLFSCVLLLTLIMTIRPYLGRYRKVFTLYTDQNNNLYVDKCLVDKNAILKNYQESVGVGNGRLKYFIIVFRELPEEIRKKNFESNAIVYCEIKTFRNWFSLKNKTQKYLQDIGVRQANFE